MKSAPSFDSNDLLSGGTGENNLFGTKTVDAMHFTEFSQNADYYQRQIANKDIVKMMNPLNYIGENNATTAKNWRIRYGTADSNTSLAVPTILATKLENKGYKVDFSMPWNVGHRGDYDLNELFTWVDSISK